MDARERTLVRGDVELDLDAYVAWVGGRRQLLTEYQFELLRALMLQDGEPLSRQQLRLDRSGSDRSVDAAVSRLRSVLSDAKQFRIEAVPQVGYRCASRLKDAILSVAIFLTAGVVQISDAAILADAL